MSFTAIVSGTDRKVSLLDVRASSAEFNRLVGSSNKFECDLCGMEMLVRGGHSFRPHFYHRPSANVGECKGIQEWHVNIKEVTSKNHMLAVSEVIENIRSNNIETRVFDLYKNCSIDIEHKIPMDWRPKGRIADIFVTIESGAHIVHEVQLSGITKEQIEERTIDYEKAGISEVIWWLGKEARTEEVKAWSYERLGGLWKVDFND